MINYLAPNLGADSVCKPAHCAPFNDIHFRRALLYAIDRSVIAQQVFHGEMEPLCGLIPRGMLGYDPSLCSLTPYDPARARTELALAKKDFGGSIPHDGSNTLIYSGGDLSGAHAMVALQNMWKKVGLHISLTALPTNITNVLGTKNTTPFLTDGWFADYPDPQDFAEYLLTKGSAYNVGNYYNPAYERLVQQGDTTFDPKIRARIYVQAQRIAIQDVAIIQVGQVVAHELWKPNVHVLSLWGDFTKISVS
jgi:ABC-type transport system substrate-binding protein